MLYPFPLQDCLTSPWPPAARQASLPSPRESPCEETLRMQLLGLRNLRSKSARSNGVLEPSRSCRVFMTITIQHRNSGSFGSRQPQRKHGGSYLKSVVHQVRPAATPSPPGSWWCLRALYTHLSHACRPAGRKPATPAITQTAILTPSVPCSHC